MNIRLLLIVFIILKSTCLMAQNIGHSVSGIVVDSLKNSADFVYVSLLENSVIKKDGFTDNDGSFKFENIENGRYTLLIKDIRFDDKSIVIEVGKNINLDSIVLSESKMVLDDIVVIGKSIKRGANKYSISLNNTQLSEGKTTNQLLSILPGMSTSMDNSVIFRGKSFARVYIDNRIITNMDELNALESSQISSIDVNYNGGSQYDAQLSGAIVKINLKKLQDGGYDGSLGVTATVRPKYGYSSSYANSIFNYQYKKLNIYNYLSLSDYKTILEYDIHNLYKNTDTESTTNTETIGKDRSLNENLTFSYQFNNKHSLGLSMSAYVSRDKPIETSKTETITNDVASPSSSQIARNISTNKYQAVMRYNWNIDKKGSYFKVDADYLYNDIKSVADYIFDYSDISSRKTMYSNLSTPKNMLDISPKMELNLGENTTFGSGVRYYYNGTTRDIDYEDVNEGVYTPNDQLSDYFKVKGQGAAAYVEGSSQWKSLSFGAGLRYQYDAINHNSLSQGVNVKKNYSKLYPSANIGYSLDDKELYFSLSYSRNIGYIPYNEISPAVHFLTEYSYTKGNPDLDISTDNSLDFSVTFKEWEFWYSYSRTTNGIEYFTYIDTENPLVRYSMPKNAGHTNWHGAGVSRGFNIFKWWRTDVDLFVNYRDLTYYEDGIDRGYRNTVFKGSLSNTLTFKNNFGGFVNFYGETRSIADDKTMDPVWSMSIGVYKYFLNKRLLARVQSQPFISKLRNTSIDNLDLYSRSMFRTKQQNFSFSLSFLFKKGKTIRQKNVNQIQSIETRTEKQ